MEKTNLKKYENKSSFWKRLKLKLFFSEMSTAKLVTQTTLAGMLISLAVVIERFVMLNAGSFEICFGFFIILLFPLLLDFRIAVVAAMVSVTITEFLISGEDSFWIHYIPILVSFPIIKSFMLFDKKWLFAIGLLVAMAAYVFVASVEMRIYKGEAFELMFIASKTLQMLIAIPVAVGLYIPLKRVMPKQTDNSWEAAPCCDECEPVVNTKQVCCDDDCEDGCKDNA